MRIPGLAGEGKFPTPLADIAKRHIDVAAGKLNAPRLATPHLPWNSMTWKHECTFATSAATMADCADAIGTRVQTTPYFWHM